MKRISKTAKTSSALTRMTERVVALEVELAAERARLDWMAEKAKQSYTGLSIDSWRTTNIESNWTGWAWRLLWHHHAEPEQQNLRAAIDAAMKKSPNG